jgi:hypothetical protein
MFHEIGAAKLKLGQSIQAFNTHSHRFVQYYPYGFIGVLIMLLLTVIYMTL